MPDQLTRDLDHILLVHSLPFAERLRERRKMTLARCLRFRVIIRSKKYRKRNRDMAKFVLKKDQIILLKIRAERATGYCPGDMQ